jgi:hypothetical protein
LKTKKNANLFFEQLLAELMVVMDRDEEDVAEIEGFISTASHLIRKNIVARAA